jgi:splicing factor U2AF subunit
LYAELSPVTDFGEACCRQYELSECTRGGFCNFMHLKPVSKVLKKELYEGQRLSIQTLKPRGESKHAPRKYYKTGYSGGREEMDGFDFIYIYGREEPVRRDDRDRGYKRDDRDRGGSRRDDRRDDRRDVRRDDHRSSTRDYDRRDDRGRDDRRDDYRSSRDSGRGGRGDYDNYRR